MSAGHSWEGIRQVRATLLGARHIPERLCGGYVYLGRYIKCSTCTFFTQEARPYMNVALFPLATMSSMMGVWTVVVVTTHRYIAVCMPHRVKKFASLRVARYQASSA